MSSIQGVSRWNKAWILATISSLMLFGLYWVQSAYGSVHLDIIQNRPFLDLSLGLNLWLDHVIGSIADTLRIIAVIFLFLTVYLAWGPKKQPFTSVKKYLAAAALFEAVYWLAILPFNLVNIATGWSPQLLYIGFAFQILAAGLPLLILAAKLWRYKTGTKADLLRWGCVAGVGYVFGMWINIMFRWLSMGLDLTSGIVVFGFLNTAVTLMLSLVFAVAGAYLLIRQSNSTFAVRLIGVAVLLFGLHFAFYIVYAWFAPNAWRFVLLTEIWPLPLIGLSIGMFRGKL